MKPKDLGYRMPAEWEQRQRTFMEWPMREEIWVSGMEEAKAGYAEVAKAIAEFEECVMITPSTHVEEVKAYCGESVTILEINNDDSWMRDNGPTFLLNQEGELAGVNWKFNAWGEKYIPFNQDDLVAGKVLEHYNVKTFNAPFVLEGGAIHVDGIGTLLTTEECLLNKNRNPHLTKEEIANYLNEYLNVNTFIWLKRGLFGDETDGHVDNVACFVREGVIALQVCYDETDPNYEITQENLEILRNARDAKGRSFEILEIEQPPLRMLNGERLTLSYINYYPVEGGIILPIFGGDAAETDKMAILKLQAVYPNRKVVTVDGMKIIKGGGNVHCITQQMPVGIIK